MGRRTCDLCGSEDKVWLVGGFARCEACEAVDAVDLLRSWTDPEKLTLDVLRRELGEPMRTFDGGESGWLVSTPMADRWVNWVSGQCWMKGVGNLKNLGQLRRIISVIQETTPGGGDAAK